MNYGKFSLFSTSATDIEINNCLFENNINPIFSLSQSFALINNITVRNHFCQNNLLGCILISETNSETSINQSVFLNVTTVEKGNIFLINSSLTVFETKFTSISSLKFEGSCLSSLNSSLLIESTFYENFTFNCLYFSQSKVSISQSSFIASDQGVPSKDLLYFGTIICEFCSFFHINDSIFQNQKFIKEAGAILLISSLNEEDFLIEKCYFFNNLALNKGGALALYDAIVLLKDNIFSKNYANYGGAIFYDSSKKESKIYLDNNSFIENEGFIDGGAIKWTYSEPYNIESNNFKGNNAKYGKNIATLPIRMNVSVSSSENSSISRIFEKEKIENIPLLTNLLSTAHTNYTFYIEMIDKYGEVVTTIEREK